MIDIRLSFLADLRSPIARQWIRLRVARGDAVQVISSYPVAPDVVPGAQLAVVPFTFARATSRVTRDGAETASPVASRLLRTIVPPTRAAQVRAVINPVSVRLHRGRLESLLRAHRPDVLHAMRIPYEGMAAAHLRGVPLLVSVWGNDFTLYARRSRILSAATQRTLSAADALHCDCARDAAAARALGFEDRPIWLMPGNGGVDTSVFHPGPSGIRARLGLPEAARLIVNPRGIREYVRTDVFFAALSAVLEREPDVHVLCPGMADSAEARRLRALVAHGERVHLLPWLEAPVMAELFRASRLSVSLSTHDGTPNTLLEAMACGTLPLVSPIESVLEWVTDRHNGLVVAGDDPAGVAEAMLDALHDDDLWAAARRVNVEMVGRRAAIAGCRSVIDDMYRSVAR